MKSLEKIKNRGDNQSETKEERRFAFLDYKLNRTSNAFFELGRLRRRVFTLMFFLAVFAVAISLSIDANAKVSILGVSIPIPIKIISLLAMMSASTLFFSWVQMTITARIHQEQIRIIIEERYHEREWAWYTSFPTQDLTTLLYRKGSVGFIIRGYTP